MRRLSSDSSVSASSAARLPSIARFSRASSTGSRDCASSRVKVFMESFLEDTPKSAGGSTISPAKAQDRQPFAWEQSFSDGHHDKLPSPEKTLAQKGDDHGSSVAHRTRTAGPQPEVGPRFL